MRQSAVGGRLRDAIRHTLELGPGVITPQSIIRVLHCYNADGALTWAATHLLSYTIKRLGKGLLYNIKRLGTGAMETASNMKQYAKKSCAISL